MRWLALTLLALAPVAFADDEKPFRGFYGGLGVGGGNAHSTWITDATTGTLDEQVDHNARGGLLGGQFGYRWSAGGPLRAGLEFAWYGGKMEDRSDTKAIGIADQERVTKVMNPGSLAVQLGIAGGSRAFIYARGGLAFANIELQAINHLTNSVATWEGTALGWTAGTGLEIAVRRNWTVGLEYDYARLSAKDRITTDTGGTQMHANDLKTRTRIGLLRINFLY